MIDLEQAVRESLARHQAEAPNGDLLLAKIRHSIHVRSPKRRRTHAYAAMAAVVAAVIALPLVLTAVLGGDGSGGQPADGGLDGPQQRVAFHGVDVTVPADWMVATPECGRGGVVDSVILDYRGPGQDCALAPQGGDSNAQPGGIRVVRLVLADSPNGQILSALAAQPTTTKDGKQALAGHGRPKGYPMQLAVLRIPDAGVVVSVESYDLAAADRILATTSVFQPDPNGCQLHAGTFLPPPPQPGVGAAGGVESPPPPADTDAHLLPNATPDGAAVCLYDAGWLVRSAALQPDQVRQLVAMVRRLEPGRSQPLSSFHQSAARCLEALSHGYMVRFTFPARSPVTVDVRLTGCRDLGATNGTHSGKLTEKFSEFLSSAVRDEHWNTMAFPPPPSPR
jgi:hypothetical protein